MNRAVASPSKLVNQQEDLNEKLKGGSIRLKIERRGDSLSLRGMFPPKPGSKADRRKVQTYLSIGEKYTSDGLTQAYNIALRVWSALQQGTFDWYEWVEVKNYESCQVWIDKYRRVWLKRRGDNAINRNKFKEGDWKFALKYLPADQDLTAELLIETAQLKKPNSRSRQLLVQGLARLAKFAEIPVDLSKYKGTYSASSVKDRKIPTDEEILTDYQKLRGKWRLIIVRMMLYGLRDHEAFMCKISPEPPYLCEVLDGKTGPRQNIIPAYVEWAEAWKPWEGTLPQVGIEKKGEVMARRLYGERTARQYQRLGINAERTPYDYRHAYALRLSLVYGMSVPEAAKLMGHSPTVYLKTYSKHLDAHRVLENYQKLMNSDQRPVAPLVNKD